MKVEWRKIRFNLKFLKACPNLNELEYVRAHLSRAASLDQWVRAGQYDEAFSKSGFLEPVNFLISAFDISFNRKSSRIFFYYNVTHKHTLYCVYQYSSSAC